MKKFQDGIEDLFIGNPSKVAQNLSLFDVLTHDNGKAVHQKKIK